MDNKLHNNVSIPLQQQLNSLLKLYQTKHYSEAEKLSLSITQEFPEHQFSWKVLAAVLKLKGKINESLIASQKSVKLNPQDAEAHSNLGVLLQEVGKLNEAEISCRKAITLKPDFTEAHYNLGVTLQEVGKLNEAATSYEKAITLKPDYTEAHNNLGVMLQEVGKLNEAETSYRKAITLKPDYAEAYNNLSVLLQEVGKLNEAEISCRKAITLKPDYTEAHNNLGVLLLEVGKLDEAKTSYSKAIELEPEYDAAWNNLFLLLKAIKFQDSSAEYRLPLLDKKEIKMNAKISKSILNYRLNQGSSSTDKFLKEALNILSTVDNTVIKNPKFASSELFKPTLPKKITALVHFGRSGTGLLHSLIDGHPEVSTLPSIYFSEFFDHSAWEKIIAGGWEEMADRFVSTYEVLFDASSTVPIITKGKKFIHNIGQKEGMTTVGRERNEALSVDKKVFVKELKQFISFYDHLDHFTFFKLIHSAYERAIDNDSEKNHIFYHIHNPDTYAQLNFLRLAPNTNWVMMVREPLQGCESWITIPFLDNDYKTVSSRIFQMLFEVDQAIFRNDNSIGVKLEDLKHHPKKTIQALCNWLGIKEEDSLYQMTAQGKRWWGDRTNPEFVTDEMEPFGKSSINQKLGSVFSENDQYILRTLFYPFSVRFGYLEENLEKFKNDLQKIRPMLDQMFDFEKKIAQNKKMNTEKFMKSALYLFLRCGMIERWNTLNKFHTYPNMLTPLKIN